MRWKRQTFSSRKSYLEYYKTTLLRVSFCNKLMGKEYLKAKSLISPLELRSLNAWLVARNLHIKLKME